MYSILHICILRYVYENEIKNCHYFFVFLHYFDFFKKILQGPPNNFSFFFYSLSDNLRIPISLAWGLRNVNKFSEF